MSYPVIKPKKIRSYQICKCCVMDTTDEDIVFDSNGVCMRCNEYKLRIEPEWNHGKGHEKELQQLITAIKKSGAGKKYDCILGLSGGLDSSYMLHLAVKEWGLRPFVFHIDCGWNLPVAEKNIKRLTDKLGVKLHIKHMNWDEMREMQLAWFRTGLESLDDPQDHAFIALIDKYSRKLGVKYSKDIDLSYIYCSAIEELNEQKSISRLKKADYVFLFGDRASVPDFLWKTVKNTEIVYGIGTKNFGLTNGNIYIHRFDENYYSRTVVLNEDYMLLNNKWDEDWGLHYVDLIKPVEVKDGEVRVFTADGKYISQDCEHLTRAGAIYYANIINFDDIFFE